jgi:hypothetical protein
MAVPAVEDRFRWASLGWQAQDLISPIDGVSPRAPVDSTSDPDLVAVEMPAWDAPGPELPPSWLPIDAALSIQSSWLLAAAASLTAPLRDAALAAMIDQDSRLEPDLTLIAPYLATAVGANLAIDILSHRPTNLMQETQPAEVEISPNGNPTRGSLRTRLRRWLAQRWPLARGAMRNR